MTRTLPKSTHHTELVPYLVREVKADSYLEIGVQTGATWKNVTVPVKRGVDPSPAMSETDSSLFIGTSDMYFNSPTGKRERFDVVFVDGWHDLEQAVRDWENSLGVLNQNGIVIFHDVFPPTEEHAKNPYLCGDVFRIVLYILETTKYKIELWENDFGTCAVYTDPSLYPIRQELPKRWLRKNYSRKELWSLCQHYKEHIRSFVDFHEDPYHPGLANFNIELAAK